MENLENTRGQYSDTINKYLDANKDDQFNLETTAIAASRVFAVAQNPDALDLARNNPAIAKMWDIFQKSNELQKATIDQIIEVQKASHAFIQVINKRDMLQAAAIITVKNQLNTLNIENREIYETIKKLAGNVLERFTQLESKIEHVEAVASLTQWIQNLKWRKYDEDPYMKRFFRILEDFYVTSGKSFTLQNLESLKTALDQSAINPFDAVSIEDFTTTLVDELMEHDFNENMGHSPYNAKHSFDEVNNKISLPFLSSLYLISEEYNHLTKRRYPVHKIRDDIKQAALCYLKKDCGIDVSAKLEYYHLGIELLNGRRLIEFLDSPATARPSVGAPAAGSPIEIDTSQERYKAYMDMVLAFLHDDESPGVIDDEEQEMLKMKQGLLKLSDEEAGKIEESAMGNHQNKEEAENKYREEVRKVLGDSPQITAKKRMRLDLSAQSFGISADVAKNIETEAIEAINTNILAKVEVYRKLVREKLEEAHEISPKTRIFLDLKVEELGLNKKIVDKVEKEELSFLEAKAEQDGTLAVELLRKAAERGDKEAQYSLGDCHFYGTGVPEDKAEAIIWFRKAAEQGHAEAQDQLGDCYSLGLGVKENEKEAAKWYLKAAEQGYASAQLSLGRMYAEGNHFEQNDSAAAKWFRKAAEQGHAEAQYELGNCYSLGWGVKEDDKEAAKWYLKAAEQGHADAQYELGDFYQLGLGVKEDEKEARKWFRMIVERCEAMSDLSYTWGIINGFLSDDGIWIEILSLETGDGIYFLEVTEKDGTTKDVVGYKLINLKRSIIEEGITLGKKYRFKGSLWNISSENQLEVQLYRLRTI